MTDPLVENARISFVRKKGVNGKMKLLTAAEADFTKSIPCSVFVLTWNAKPALARLSGTRLTTGGAVYSPSAAGANKHGLKKTPGTRDAKTLARWEADTERRWVIDLLGYGGNLMKEAVAKEGQTKEVANP